MSRKEAFILFQWLFYAKVNVSVEFELDTPIFKLNFIREITIFILVFSVCIYFSFYRYVLLISKLMRNVEKLFGEEFMIPPKS